MKRLLFLIAALLWAVPAASAQHSVIQSGQVTPGHVPYWITNGVLGDGGTAQTPKVTSFGTVGQGNTICANSAPVTGPYQQLCLGTNTATGGTISLQGFGGAPVGSLNISVNGVTFPLGAAPLTIGLSQIVGGVAGDCLIVIGSGASAVLGQAPCGSGGSFNQATPYLATGATTARALVDVTNDHGLNIKNFGAIGDGSSHPLSGIYANLAAAQAVYPFVSDLTQEVDWAATQAALNYTYANGNEHNVFCPSVQNVNEKYVLSNPLIVNPTGLVSYTAWAVGTTYGNGANAMYNGLPWVSLGSGNVGNPPTSKGGYPQGFPVHSFGVGGVELPFGNATISNGSPAVITSANHGQLVGTPIIFLPDTYDSGAVLPTGINANQVYYVISGGLTTNTFEVSATPGGSAVNTSSAGVGVFTFSNRVWDLAIQSTQFSDQSNFVGEANVPGDRGCQFQFLSTTAPAIVYLPGNGNYIANVAVDGPSSAGGSGTYRCQTPTESVGIGTPTNGGGPSRTLLSNIGADGFYTGWQSNIPDGQGVLGDSNTIIKGHLADSCNGVFLEGTQNFINSAYDTSFEQDNTPVAAFFGTRFNVFGGNDLAFSGAWNVWTISSVANPTGFVFTATITGGANGFPDGSLNNPLCGYNLQCAYGIVNIVSARYGIVPFHITAFNPATQQITLTLNSDWSAAYSNQGPGADFISDIEAATSAYASEVLNTYLGGGILVQGTHIENDGVPDVLGNSVVAFGSNDPLHIQDVLENSTITSNSDSVCCNQGGSPEQLAQFYGQTNIAWLAPGGGGGIILDGLSGGGNVQANNWERVLISGGYIEFRHVQPTAPYGLGAALNNRVNSGGAGNGNFLSGASASNTNEPFGGLYGPTSSGFGAGESNNPAPWVSVARTYADVWRAEQWGITPSWGVRPAPSSAPCITPAHEAALASPAAITYTSSLNWVGLSSGGTGYQVGDTITLVGGTFTTAATITVSSVNGGGTITGFHNQNGPSYQTANGGNLTDTFGNQYTVEPTTFTATGGHGSNATFNNPVWVVRYLMNYPMLFGGQKYQVCNWSISPTAYSAGTTYAQGALVTSSSITYVSLINGNIGNTPVSSPTDWAVFKYALLSNNIGYSYFQNLTTTNVPNLAWTMTGGSQWAYMNQEALELMFPGLVLTLTPSNTPSPCPATAITFIVTEVHPIGGYVKLVDVAAQQGNDTSPKNIWGDSNTCTGTIIGQAAPNIVNPY